MSPISFYARAEAINRSVLETISWHILMENFGPLDLHMCVQKPGGKTLNKHLEKFSSILTVESKLYQITFIYALTGKTENS